MALAPDRGDGRKTHYGDGRQPLDDIIEQGWAPAFCAGNILKYLRRAKDPEYSLESARFYWKMLVEQARTDPYATYTYSRLCTLLSPAERTLLNSNSYSPTDAVGTR